MADVIDFSTRKTAKPAEVENSKAEKLNKFLDSLKKETGDISNMIVFIENNDGSYSVRNPLDNGTMYTRNMGLIEAGKSLYTSFVEDD